MSGQEKPKIELAEDPEYADLVVVDFTLHGNEQRSPKEWYPEFLYNSKLGQGGRIYSTKQNNKAEVIEGVGTILEQRFPVSLETAKSYNQAKNSGRGFRLYVPKEGVKIIFHDSLKERIKSANKKLGYDRYSTEDGFYAQLCGFDIIDGDAIIRVLIK